MGERARFVAADDGPTYRVLGTTMTVKADVAATGGAVEIVVADTVRGADVPPHRHPWAESYFVLDGELEVTVGGRTNIARTGDLLTIPSRAVHAFRVVTESARFLHVSTGPGATALFADADASVPDAPGPDDLAAVLDLADRHGVELIAPQG